MNRYKKSRLFIIVSVLSIISLSFLFLTTKNSVEIPLVSSGAKNVVSVVNEVLAGFSVHYLQELRRRKNDN